MLAAELRKKLGRALSCAVCNQTTSAESYFGFEDVLTSNVFGALRYLDPRYGLHAVLRDVDVGSFTDATIEFWPCRNGCEPDVVIDTPETLIVVETKLRSTFGHNQLPREVLFAHHRAAGRPWRLLCITDETREPRHAAYGPDRTLIAGSALSLGAGVATYFARTNETDLTAEEIARRVVWMPWWRVGTCQRA